MSTLILEVGFGGELVMEIFLGILSVFPKFRFHVQPSIRKSTMKILNNSQLSLEELGEKVPPLSMVDKTL